MIGSKVTVIFPDWMDFCQVMEYHRGGVATKRGWLVLFYLILMLRTKVCLSSREQ